jgi:electron transfer flavoprotein alpha subunit
VLVAGANAGEAAKAATHIAGVAKVIAADSPSLAESLAENVAAQILAIAKNYSHILFPSTANGKNAAPRVAAKLDVAQVSDITNIDSPDTIERPIYADKAIATMRSSDAIKGITVRSTGFDAAPSTGGSASVENAEGVADSGKSSFVGREVTKSKGLELTAAKIIISGGPALGSVETFQEVMAPLADKLNAALGTSRAAVDAGYPRNNNWQVGQTGKILAPQLQISVGIWGAIQHLAGMKDSGDRGDQQGRGRSDLFGGRLWAGGGLVRGGAGVGQQALTDTPLAGCAYLVCWRRSKPLRHFWGGMFVAKYANHLPLYRQEAGFGRAEVALPRWTLGAWIGMCGLQLPLVNALKAHVLRGAVVHVEEMRMAMLAQGNGRRIGPASGSMPQAPCCCARSSTTSPRRANEHPRALYRSGDR